MLRKLFINKQNTLFTLHRHLGTQIAANSTSNANFQLEQSHIDEAIKLVPTLAIYAPVLWQRAHQTFSNHGLETVNFLRIVTGNPSILQRTPERIVDSLEIWRSCQFGEKLLHLFLTKYPEMLDVTDGQRLLTQFSYLKSRVSTNRNVWKLLMNSPDILQQTEHCIEEKLNYFIDVMRIEVPEIVKSAALSSSFKDIRCRHVFLERLGLYKPRSLKADTHEPNKNHRLYQITESSEKTFATKICHVTLPEYECFQELYARELKRKERRGFRNNNINNDGDDDDDDELSDQI